MPAIHLCTLFAVIDVSPELPVNYQLNYGRIKLITEHTQLKKRHARPSAKIAASLSSYLFGISPRIINNCNYLPMYPQCSPVSQVCLSHTLPTVANCRDLWAYRINWQVNFFSDWCTFCLPSIGIDSHRFCYNGTAQWRARGTRFKLIFPCLRLDCAGNCSLQSVTRAWSNYQVNMSGYQIPRVYYNFV